MNANAPKTGHCTPRRIEATERFRDGDDRLVSFKLSLEEFLAKEDARMVSLIRLYLDRRSDGLPPTDDLLKPEFLFTTGMMNRTHCLRVEQGAGNARYTVWAPDANFDGFRNLQNVRVDELAGYQVMAEAIKSQLAAILVHGRPTFHEMRGVINGRYYYYTKAMLPLRNNQGDIIKCLVPFTNKLPDIPPELRKKCCTADID